MEAVVETIRLARDELYRVGGTRVTLDLVVRAFDHGDTAEDIAREFPVSSYQTVGRSFGTTPTPSAGRLLRAVLAQSRRAGRRP